MEKNTDALPEDEEDNHRKVLLDIGALEEESAKSKIFLKQLMLTEQKSRLLYDTASNMHGANRRIEEMLMAQNLLSIRLIKKFTQELHSVFSYLSEMKERLEQEMGTESFQAGESDDEADAGLDIWGNRP